ncbi:hypothetical protein [Candidatus Thiodiazotropha sp. CDECU1]|uniref:hypothetical protein n=1 Tax=Candidatus Thiodiazotropha sp. CDECU1 TaxID=3065865 RepID=UPI002931B606|nr:hypothetical protein [Candidatus Thiodiazotropha sp. CDECU1]
MPSRPSGLVQATGRQTATGGLGTARLHLRRTLGPLAADPGQTGHQPVHGEGYGGRQPLVRRHARQVDTGPVARWEHERRVYVVTITPEMEDAVHDRWPRILSGNQTPPRRK